MFKSERKVDRLNRVHGITTSRGHTIPSTKTTGEGWWNTVALNHEYFTPVALFTVLFAVLWMTDDKLGWFSFMIRDGWTFTAFVVTYIAFAPAFMREKDKIKKTPLFKKAMVFITIMAVDFALIGVNPANIFDWGWNQASPQPTAQVTPPAPRKQPQIIKVVAEQGIFKEVVVPDGYKFDLHCPPNTFMGITHRGLPQGKTMDCDEDIKISLGDNLRDLRLSFISANAVPKTVVVTLEER